MIKLREEARFTTDPKQRELNEQLMKFQRSVAGMGEAQELASQVRLRPQEAVTASGYLARGGLHVPVSSAVTVLLAKPTPNTAGQPLALYNSSGGVVLLDPVDCTLNGADVGWLSPGLTVLWPDASGWYGANTRAVEFVAAGTIEGTTTGAEGVSVAEAGSNILTRMLFLGAALQGVTFGGNPILSGGSSTNSFAPLTSGCSNTNSTVAAGVWRMMAAGCPPHVASGSLTVLAPDAGTDLTLFALLLNGADQTIGLERVDTDGTGTSIESGTITTTRPGAMILDFLANDASADTPTPGAGQTVMADGAPSSSTVALHSSYKPMPRPGTTTMSWSALTNAANKAHIALVIEPGEGA